VTFGSSLGPLLASSEAKEDTGSGVVGGRDNEEAGMQVGPTRLDDACRGCGGESYKVCAACGKSSREPAYSRSEGQQGRLREGDKGMDDIGGGGPTGGGP
jgi:ribosomal protein L37E